MRARAKETMKNKKVIRPEKKYYWTVQDYTTQSENVLGIRLYYVMHLFSLPPSAFLL